MHESDIILSSTGTYLGDFYGILMKISNTEEFLWGKDTYGILQMKLSPDEQYLYTVDTN